MTEDGRSTSTTRRAVLAAAAGAGAAGVASALSDGGGDGSVYGGIMALSQEYNVSGDLWIGPDSTKSNVSPDAGRVFLASDTQVEYHGDGNQWVKMGIGSSQEAVPSVNTDEAYTDRLQGEQRNRPMYQANRIRERAGVPEGIEFGVRSSRTVGLSDSTALSDDTRIAITSETDAQNESSSGSGTESDPYVIKDKRLDNSEGSTDLGGIFFDDSSGDYWVKIQNCEINGYDNRQVNPDLGGGVIIENCKIYDNDARWLVIHDAGAIRIRETHFAGLPNSSDEGILLSEDVDDYLIEDCLFDEEQQSWSGTTLINVSSPSSDHTYPVRYCEFDAPNADSNLIDTNGRYEFVFEHCHVRNWANSELWSISPTTGTVKFSKFEDGGGADAYIEFNQQVEDVSDVEVAFSDFAGIDSRHVFFDPADDSEIHHCKSTQTLGSGAGTESFESRASRNVDIHHCWVTEHVEDAFEHVDGVNCTIHHCVGDDVNTQIADMFQGGNGDDSDNGGEIHHIYGNVTESGGEAVSVKGAHNVTVSDIYAEAPVAVQIKGASDGCAVLGPLPLVEKIDNKIVNISTTATDAYAIYMDGNQIVTKDSGEGLPSYVSTDIR